MNERYLWLIIFRSGNKVDGLHQKVVVEDLVNFQQQMQTDFAVGKGKYHSFNVKNEIFEAVVAFGLLKLNQVKYLEPKDCQK